MGEQKEFIIVAGPNGAGKTTFVQNIFPKLLSENKFLNADQFAVKLNPYDVAKVALAAGKQFLKEVDKFLKEDESFIIETTLSGKGLLKKIEAAHKNGFETRLIFLWISRINLCDFRVKGRVASGGHNIPLRDISRRYKRGLTNFKIYSEVVDEYEVFLADETPSLIFSKNKHKGMIIKDTPRFEKFELSIQSVRD